METAARRLEVLTAQLRDSTADGRLLHMTATASPSTSAFREVSQAPPDAILGISEAFKRDKNPKKINLGVGAYRTEEGKPLVLDVVRQAERQIVSDASSDKEYLGIGGNPDFCRLSAILAFGEGSTVLQQKRNITVHSLSGTGSLRVGAEFLARNYPHKLILLPTPTWPNHNKLFPLAGIKVQPYRYFKAQTRGLDYEGMLQDMRSAPEGSIVLLHACAHNPTGVDPTAQQWQGILRVVQERQLLPFFDSAYQGFATGDLEGDAHAIRLFADAGMEMLVAQSFAKNLGLYGERVGALTVVTSDPAVTKRVESQLKSVIRPLYSNPPRHGAAIVVAILSDSELYKQWRTELQGMADRIKSMRSQLFQALKDANAPGDWSHIVNQIGMFSYTGLTREQVQNMTEKWHIYMTFDGRISMAGLSGAKCAYLAEAICDSLQ